jgi:hypothetical protein
MDCSPYRQSVALNSSNEVSDVSVFDYDSRPVGLVAVVLADVFVDPSDGGIGERAKQKNRAVILNFEINCGVGGEFLHGFCASSEPYRLGTASTICW